MIPSRLLPMLGRRRAVYPVRQPVVGPYVLAAGLVYTLGAVAGDVYSPGAVAADVHSPGATAGLTAS